MNELKVRLKKIKSLKNKVDEVLLFNNDPNLFYFTNNDAGIFLYDFSSPRLVATRFDLTQVKKSWIRNIPIIDAKTQKQMLHEILKLTHGTVGINKKSISAILYEKIKGKIKTRDISDELEEIRMIKSQYEIACIRKACRINRRVFDEIELRKGITENEVAGIAEIAARKMGSRVEINVAFGKNTAEPHHKPTDKKLSKKEPAWIDICCCYKGYYSDVTRSFNHPLQGKLARIISELEIRPGIKASSLEKAVRKQLGKDEKYFTHSLGHGIGISIHERPWISTNSKDVLKPNMVFTIEPGIYNKNGVRVENDFLLTKSGCKILTDF